METLLLEAENFKKGGWFLLYLLFVKNLKTILAFQLFKDAPLVKDILCLFPLSHFFLPYMLQQLAGLAYLLDRRNR